MVGFLMMIIAFQLVANYFGLFQKNQDWDFLPLYILNFGHYLILFLYDTLVIDYGLLGKWRPGFLRLPEKMGQISMRKHILLSLPVGIGAGSVLCVVVTLISYFLLFFPCGAQP